MDRVRLSDTGLGGSWALRGVVVGRIGGGSGGLCWAMGRGESFFMVFVAQRKGPLR